MFLGIVMITPVVKLIPDSLQPSLEWHEIMRYGQPAGKLLASCELLLVRMRLNDSTTKTDWCPI